jgi:hypothetical protein
MARRGSKGGVWARAEKSLYGLSVTGGGSEGKNNGKEFAMAAASAALRSRNGVGGSSSGGDTRDTRGGHRSTDDSGATYSYVYKHTHTHKHAGSHDDDHASDLRGGAGGTPTTPTSTGGSGDGSFSLDSRRQLSTTQPIIGGGGFSLNGRRQLSTAQQITATVLGGRRHLRATQPIAAAAGTSDLDAIEIFYERLCHLVERQRVSDPLSVSIIHKVLHLNPKP